MEFDTTNMAYFGELISILVAFSWTFTALFFESAGKRIGSLNVNLLRLCFAAIMLGGMLYFTTGSFTAAGADLKTWGWMSLSGVVGLVFGDFCLFYSYMLITSRYSQLFMTLAPPFAALFGWVLLGEKLSFMGFAGMFVTLFGIAISILKRGSSQNSLSFKIPRRGALFALGGALGQGGGLVLSKIGMNHYETLLHSEGVSVDYLPFAATQIRILTGIVGFVIIMLISKRMKNYFRSLRDVKALATTLGGSVFGPFIGVSLSLMAVRYTNIAIASTIMATTPILILIPYRIMYKKHISTIEIVGAVISVAGVSLFFI